MKNRKMKQILGIILAASVELPGMAAAVPAVTAYAEETAAETETETEETEAAAEKEPMPDVEVVADGTTVVLKNETGIAVTEAFLEEAEEAEDQETETDTGEEDSTEVETVFSALVLVDAEGEKHVLEAVDLLAVTDPVLTEENGFFYLSYTGESQIEYTVAETAEEKTFEEPVTMYVVDTVYIRAAADSDSDVVGVASLGAELTAVGASPKWVHVFQDETEGYVSQSYVSRSRENAEQAVAEEEAARARIAAEAAQAAAAQAAAAQAAASSGSSSGGRTEVSRQKYDDCDGSGHGYYEITYSDGSTEIEEY